MCFLNFKRDMCRGDGRVRFPLGPLKMEGKRQEKNAEENEGKA